MQGNKPGKKRRKNPNQSGDNLCKETNQAKKKKPNQSSDNFCREKKKKKKKKKTQQIKKPKPIQ
jgi:hypothetical protein